MEVDRRTPIHPQMAQRLHRVLCRVLDLAPLATPRSQVAFPPYHLAVHGVRHRTLDEVMVPLLPRVRHLCHPLARPQDLRMGQRLRLLLCRPLTRPPDRRMGQRLHRVLFRPPNLRTKMEVDHLATNHPPSQYLLGQRIKLTRMHRSVHQRLVPHRARQMDQRATPLSPQAQSLLLCRPLTRPPDRRIGQRLRRVLYDPLDRRTKMEVDHLATNHPPSQYLLGQRIKLTRMHRLVHQRLVPHRALQVDQRVFPLSLQAQSQVLFRALTRPPDRRMVQRLRLLLCRRLTRPPNLAMAQHLRRPRLLPKAQQLHQPWFHPLIHPPDPLPFQVLDLVQAPVPLRVLVLV
jgi:hypothetical protein